MKKIIKFLLFGSFFILISNKIIQFLNWLTESSIDNSVEWVEIDELTKLVKIDEYKK